MASDQRYHQPKIDPQTRDFVLDKGGRLVFVADSEAVKQTSWMRVVARFGSYVYDPTYGSRLYETLRYANVQAIRLLARSFILKALRVEQTAHRVASIKNVAVESIDPRSGVNWDVSLQTEFDLTVRLSS